MEKRKHLGISKVGLVLKLFGFFPLIFGIPMILYLPEGRIFGLILVFVGIALWGYSNKVYVIKDKFILERKLFLHIISEKPIVYTNHSQIFLDVVFGSPSQHTFAGPIYYSIQLLNLGTSQRQKLDWDKFTPLGVTKNIRNNIQPGWERVTEYVSELSRETGIKVIYSDQLKSYNKKNR